MSAGRPILVTGSHRSGTGWVGSMIAASPSPPVAYLWEPFSVLHRPGICEARFPYWFPYVSAENEPEYVEAVRNMLAFRYGTGAELRAVRSPKHVARLVRDRARFARFARRRARPLLKDPIAVFSAEWLADSFDMDVVVLIRHPAAFADSIRTRRLRHPFDHFLAQPLLMRDVLAPFEEDVRRFAEREQPLLDQGILLWNLIHHAIVGYRRQRPAWSFLRLEDIARDPAEVFRGVFDRLGQTFDEGVRRTIESHSSAGNPVEAADPASRRRDSRAAIENWRRRLTPEEIERVRDGVEPLSSEFYTDDDW
ncbi:MAG: sulfotransferase [Actinobacteria bacterium]|nr:sulfotransferase [Actinomycetota bacterium]